MKLLYYNELDTSKVKQQFKKVEKAIAEGDFRTADVKKMQSTGYYRAKLDRENRLLFKFVTYKEETYILLLEVIHHHAYEKSKFLRGAEVDENKFKTISNPAQIEKDTSATLRYLNEKSKHLHVLDKFISFDDEQKEIYGLPTPLVIIGSAGSGKTALTLEKMKYLRGHIAYVSLSSYLVENSQKTYYTFNYENEHQEVDFLSFKEYLESIHIPTGREINFKVFAGWYARYKQTAKIRDDYKLYEEFKGVLTGSPVHTPYLSRKEYLSLGVKQSIFLKADRDRVYDVFEKYLTFLDEGKFYDSNIVAWNYLQQVQAQYDFIVVDEVQDFTNIQLSLILKSLAHPTNFFLSGDSNQIVHPNFFSWSKLKSLFFQSELKGGLLRILKTNYRNSQKITDISNRLLKIKNARFGSIDKESTYLIDTVSHVEGEINLLTDSDTIKKDLNKKTEQSAHFAVLVMNDEDKVHVRKFFKTPLIFSIHEAKGLEYENIILVNFISKSEKEFREITSGVTNQELEDDELRYSRAKNKENKELEEYKFYINSLYVAFTRAVKNLYIIESRQKHDLLKLLNLTESGQKLKLKTQTSNEQEWLEEARRLELQGKLDQAEEIRARMRGVSYINADQLAALEEEVFHSLNPSLEARQQLFNYAKDHYRIDLIERMRGKIGFGPAKQYIQEYKQTQGSFDKLCKNGNKSGIERIVKKYGINFQSPNQETGLMLSVLYNKPKLVEYFLQHEANTKLTDRKNRTVMHMALLGYELEYLDLKRMARMYSQFQLPFIKIKYKDRIMKIGPKYMEYFLVIYLQAVRDAIIEPSDPKHLQGLNMDEFVEFIEEMPESILPEYRRKRQYVNSILAKNEVDRDYIYNRFLFKRKSRGVYNLNPKMEVLYE